MEKIFQTNLPSSQHRVTSCVLQIARLTDDMVVIVGHTTVQLRAKSIVSIALTQRLRREGVKSLLFCPASSGLVQGEALRRESGVTAGCELPPMQDGLYGHMGFDKAVKLEPCHTAHTALGVHPTAAPVSGVAQQGGNALLRDWHVKILAAGSDAAVTRSTAWLSGIFSSVTS